MDGRLDAGIEGVAVEGEADRTRAVIAHHGADDDDVLANVSREDAVEPLARELEAATGTTRGDEADGAVQAVAAIRPVRVALLLNSLDPLACVKSSPRIKVENRTLQ